MRLDDFRRRVEQFASSEARGARERLYSKILGALKVAKAAFPEDILAQVLAAIVVRHGFAEAKRAEDEQHPSAEQYREEKRRVQKLLDELTESWIVKHFDPNAVKLYGFNEARCPHRRRRRDCEAIRSALVSVRAARAAGMTNGARAARARLAKAYVGADADPSKFCEASDVHKLLPPLDAPRRPGGRPAERDRRITTGRIVGLLHGDGGLTVERSCEFLADLYGHCLDIHVDAEALRQEWYAHGRKVAPPAGKQGTEPPVEGSTCEETRLKKGPV